mmetsp:Transcript_9480/g.23264  ORF Transcript_9480/g.23264 Transcript_9480/m.23264 type:complete len:646 (+) Transcript_9480:377-2314(+)|eukprot:CAMPEP_0197193968 /NCGR_PEP_ID=MMETSP1423-20130617/28386_1 /TAXON_ID=476441 /ORGANISM="Pseudo-nitzschia heimii, Strain UNC1101" /LENGTH=645 /DNA_ID=CAMNT_0042647305 /DNA_START=303 /DNA_END=2240 /DNA_ORIENTATION=-
MQFTAAAAAAAFASEAGGGIGHKGRGLASNVNLLHKPYKWSQETTRAVTATTTIDRQGSEPVRLPSAKKILKNKRGRHRVASKIVSKLEKLQKVVECDARTEILKNQRLRNHPGTEMTGDSSSFVDSAEDELGILSSACGVGRKCQDGFCVDVEDRVRYRTLQAQTPNNSFAATDLSSSGTPNNTSGIRPTNTTTIVDTMRYACEYGNLIGYNCTCDFDTNNSTYYTGSATCVTPMECTTETSVCGVNVTDCYETAYTLELKGAPGVWDAEFCLRFLEPYQQTVCYETSTFDFAETILPECTISLDGEQCAACDVYTFRDGNCYNFDCGNTVLAGNGHGSMTGNTCSLPAHSVGLYLDTFGCPPCYLCGEGMVMTAPANTMELFSTTYQCAYVQDVALQGFFTTDSCDYFAREANEPCGCSDEIAFMSGNETDDMALEMDDSPNESTVDVSIQEGLECNICPEGMSDPDGVIVLPGGEETSCSDVEAAGSNGRIVDASLCEVFQKRAAGPCCGAPVDVVFDDKTVENEAPADEFCTICGPDKTHTDDTNFVSVPTQGIYSCQELIAMGQNGTLDENGICVLVQLSAKIPCGCVADGPTATPGDPTMPPTGMDADEEQQESGAAVRFSLAASIAALAVVAAANFSW